jgi:hypothetical protein
MGGASGSAAKPTAGRPGPEAADLMTPTPAATSNARATSKPMTIPPLRTEGLPLDWVFEIGGAVTAANGRGASEVAA